MVKLTKIYTKTGDEGMTSLIGGVRLSKHHARLEAIGAVDEANAAIGIARVHVAGQSNGSLAQIQHDLFDLGADLAALADSGRDLRIVAQQVERLEHEIDAMNERLPPLNSFILPGGTAAGAALHMARTLVRRAERAIVALSDMEPVNLELRRYINRLSDHLFVLARVQNDGADILWEPGKTR